MEEIAGLRSDASKERRRVWQVRHPSGAALQVEEVTHDETSGKLISKRWRRQVRPSEVVGLTAERIKLSGTIPIVEIRPQMKRELKTVQSIRDMPLVGVALDIMTEFSQGFPRYCDCPDTLSATVNKGLGDAGLRPTPKHTMYSLRHTFKDRLIALEAPPRVQDALMGHAVGEMRYGAGPSIEQKLRWIEQVWPVST